MRRSTALLLAVATLAAAAGLAPAAEAGSKTREISRSFALESGQTLRLDLSVGEFRITGAAIARVEVELLVECRWGNEEECDRLLDKVDLESRTTSRRRIVELTGDSGWRKTQLEVEGEIRVPRAGSLEVDMGVGELTIEGVEGDVSADLGVGELTIRVPAAAVASVALDAGVGEAELLGAVGPVEGRRSMLVGSEVYWDDGPGKARIRADVGVGEATVFLE